MKASERKTSIKHLKPAQIRDPDKVSEYCMSMYKRFCECKCENTKMREVVNFGQDKLSILSAGIYGFFDNDGDCMYIGQGGGGTKTTLNARILQEFRLFKLTKGGNNGGTLSKNIQEQEGITFTSTEEFKNHIISWRIKILHSNNLMVSLDLIEALLIQINKPKYNKKGKIN